MASRHLSIRISPESLARLERESKRQRRSVSDVARTLIEEGLRMEAHPGIMFRDGPAGRRAGLRTGPDVWEIVRLYNGLDATGDEAVNQAAEWTSLRPDEIWTALRYYADFQNEIDDWIEDENAYAELAYASWLREQEVLQR